MSYRSGPRRDGQRNSGGYGGGGGGGGMNRRQNFGSGGNQVNPWQGGVVPGGNQVGGMSLLNTPNQSDLLSQLSSPEAQLAMATNLLTNILSPQQNQQQPPPVPSLMSLPMQMNRFANDFRSRSDNFRRRDDNRRPQPYSKFGNNRRNDGKPRFGKPNTDKNFSKSKKVEKKNKDENDVDGEGKKKKDSDNTDSDDKKGAKEDEGSDKEDREPGTRFKDIPAALFWCHVCHKNMWDAASFEKHVSGRSHQMMLNQLDETYKLKVELIRHEQRATENVREIEINRMQRQGKKMWNQTMEFCAMCDLHFFGNLISHRKRESHQKLKSFLHPKCSLCDKEFANRLEWDEHKLTPLHLKKVAEQIKEKQPGITDSEIQLKHLHALEVIPEDTELEVEIPKEDRKLEVENLDIPIVLDKYDPDTSVGSVLINEVTGSLCKCCNKFIYGKDSLDAHCRTFSHYKRYLNLVKLKAKEEKDRERLEAIAAKKAAGEVDKVKEEKPSSDGGDENEGEDRILNDDEEDAAMETAPNNDPAADDGI